MSVATRIFGRHEGREVIEARLESASASISVLSYGAVIRDWRVGAGAPCVLGFDRFEDYPAHSRSFGIIAGRVANRTAGGRFTLGGETFQLACNNGPHHLHGGEKGLGRAHWSLESDSAATALRLTCASPDGDDLYPGAVDFAVEMRLDGSTLTMEMSGAPDRPTPINLAQHNYYNLGGGADIRGHVLRMAADRYLSVDETLIPDGPPRTVEGTIFDFRTARTLAGPDEAGLVIDHNLCLTEDRDPAAPAATLTNPDSGLTLTLTTDQKGVQLYTARPLDVEVPGLDGRRYGPHAGVCLEPQAWPDALNRPDFPAIIATPDAPYRQRLILDIA